MKRKITILIWILALCVWSPWAMAVFDKGKPASSTSLRNSNPEILANWSALEDAIDREHSFSTGGTVAEQGEHTQGSARCFFTDTEPPTQIDGGNFESTDLGSLWFDTNSSPDNQFNVLTAADGAGNDTWTPVSDEIIAVLLAANRVFLGTLGVTGDFTVNSNFDVTASNGNTLVGGTLDVTGDIDPTTYGTANGGFLDDNSMASATADTVGSTESIKAYIDAQIIANAHSFGTWTTATQGSSTEAATDGIIQVVVDEDIDTGDWVTIKTDAADPPTVVRAVFEGLNTGASGRLFISCPVKKGDFYLIQDNGLTPTAYFLPVGN